MLSFINKYIFGTAVPIMLVLAGIYYLFALKGFHITKIGIIFRSMVKKQNKGGTSPFRALTLALAGTLGVGNIVGVSAAIYLGGFGSIFWMWVSAFCAMLLKYAEIVLAMKYRGFDKDGKPHGSAMLYIRKFLSSIGLARVGKISAAAFAVLCIINSISMGSMIQINAVTSSFDGIFDVPPFITGIVLAIVTLVVIMGGTDFISRLTEGLVPIMTVGYVVLSLAVIIIKIDSLGDALSSIFSSAFSFEGAAGGVGGFLLSRSIRYGVMRGLVSNEAGCGTAPAAHSASNSSSAVEQGFWGIFEVFVDTIVLCTMTALVVILSYSDVKHFGNNFIMMTISAYSVVLGELSAYFLVLSVLFFAFATVICWAHYGMECCMFLSPRKIYVKIFIVAYSASVLLGAIISPTIIWDCADFAIGFMTLINVLVICFMSKEVREETDCYFKTVKKGRR